MTKEKTMTKGTDCANGSAVRTVHGTLRHDALLLNYFFTLRPGKPLCIIFSAVDSVPGRNITSYFGYHRTLDASVLHIVDSFGAHGCYYMRLNGTDAITKAVSRLILEMVSRCDVTISQTWFCGTSKGASAALYYSLALGGGNCLLGEPQIMIGDFLFDDEGPRNESARSIAYCMTGRVNRDDRTPLNNLLVEHLHTHLGSWRGSVELHVGETTGYLWRHIRFLERALEQHPEAARQFNVVIGSFSNHNDVADVFKAKLEETFGILRDPSPSLIADDSTVEPDVSMPPRQLLYRVSPGLALGEAHFLLPVTLGPQGGRFHVLYNIALGPGERSRRAIVFSLLSDPKLGHIEGLSLSPMQDIGFFKYLNADNSDLTHTFSFSVPMGIEPARMALFPWESKISGATVEKLEIYRE